MPAERSVASHHAAPECGVVPQHAAAEHVVAPQHGDDLAELPTLHGERGVASQVDAAMDWDRARGCLPKESAKAKDVNGASRQYRGHAVAQVV